MIVKKNFSSKNKKIQKTKMMEEGLMCFFKLGKMLKYWGYFSVKIRGNKIIFDVFETMMLRWSLRIFYFLRHTSDLFFSTHNLFVSQNFAVFRRQWKNLKKKRRKWNDFWVHFCVISIRFLPIFESWLWHNSYCWFHVKINPIFLIFQTPIFV